VVPVASQELGVIESYLRNGPILVNEAPSAPRAALYMRVSTGRLLHWETL
jgi:hypothetical protein